MQQQIELRVTYEEHTNLVQFNFKVLRSTRSLFEAFKHKIEVNFNIKEEFHLIAFGDDGESDIENDDGVRRLFENPKHSIKAYIGGSFNIWLGKEKHWLTRLPKSTTCLIRLTKDDILRDIKTIEFKGSLHKLLRSIKFANAHLILGDKSRKLSNDLNEIGHDIKRVVSKCSDTLQAIILKTYKILDHIITLFLHLRDHHEAYARGHLEDLTEVARDMENESGERIKDLEKTERALATLLQKVQDKTYKLFSMESMNVIVRHLEEAIKELRKVRLVMNRLNRFWACVKTALGYLTDNAVLRDVHHSLTVPADKTTWDVWRSRKFKMNAVALIARHSAIRDICVDYVGPVRDLHDQMESFLEEYWDEEKAQAVLDELNDDPVADIQGAAEYQEDEETEHAVRGVLGLPYERVVREIFSVPIQESGEDDISHGNEVEGVRQAAESLAIGPEQNEEDNDDFQLGPYN